MNAKFAYSVSLRKPYLVYVVHCLLVVMAHSVAASNLLRTRHVRIQQRTICSTFFLTANNFSVILKYICCI